MVPLRSILFVSFAGPWGCAAADVGGLTPDANAGDGSAHATAPLGTTGFLAQDACKECLGRECWRQEQTCDVDADCRALRVCRTSCTDSDCDSQCLAAVPADSPSRAYEDAVATCSLYRCQSDCGAPSTLVDACLAAFDEKLPGLSSVCSEQRDCVCTGCTNYWLMCFGDPDCVKHLDCALRYCDGACSVNCAEVTGVPASSAATLARTCASRCEPCPAGADAG